LQPVSLHTFVNDQFHEQTALRGREATLLIEGELPHVLAHPTFLRQALGNLINNAIKFVPEGTRPHIHVTAESIGTRVRLWIGDNGVGIAPELQPRLFRIFERLHTDQPFEGTGMGLAIVRCAIERMGGSVGVDSAVGRGSRFWIELERSGVEPRASMREKAFSDAAVV
jgi:signal transduction histidine kinase